MLYRYGLQFSYDWANPYWFFLNATFASAGLLAATSYWLFRRPDLRNLLTAIYIFWTVFLQVFGYNLDILWNVINELMGYGEFDLQKEWGWGIANWFTCAVFQRTATALDAICCSAVLNVLTFLLWCSLKLLRDKLP